MLKVWGEKFFHVQGASTSQLHVGFFAYWFLISDIHKLTFGWGHMVTRYSVALIEQFQYSPVCSVYGYEVYARNNSGEEEEQTSDSGERVIFDKPYESSYDAPFLQFSLTAAARYLLVYIFKQFNSFAGTCSIRRWFNCCQIFNQSWWTNQNSKNG